MTTAGEVPAAVATEAAAAGGAVEASEPQADAVEQGNCK